MRSMYSFGSMPQSCMVMVWLPLLKVSSKDFSAMAARVAIISGSLFFIWSRRISTASWASEASAVAAVADELELKLELLELL